MFLQMLICSLWRLNRLSYYLIGEAGICQQNAVGKAGLWIGLRDREKTVERAERPGALLPHRLIARMSQQRPRSLSPAAGERTGESDLPVHLNRGV